MPKYANDIFALPDDASILQIKRSFNALVEAVAAAEPANVLENSSCKHLVRDAGVIRPGSWQGVAISPGVVSGTISQDVTNRLKVGTAYLVVARYTSTTDSVLTLNHSVSGVLDSAASVGPDIVGTAGVETTGTIFFVTSDSFDPAIHRIGVTLDTTGTTVVDEIECVEAGLILGTNDRESIAIDTRYDLASGMWQVTFDGGTQWSGFVTSSNLAANMASVIVDPMVTTTVVGTQLVRSYRDVLLNLDGDVQSPGGNPVHLVMDPTGAAHMTLDVREINGDLVVNGKLTVNGDTTTLNSEQITTRDPFVEVNSEQQILPQLYAGLQVKQDTTYVAPPQIRWNYSTKKWELIADDGVANEVTTAASLLAPSSLNNVMDSTKNGFVYSVASGKLVSSINFNTAGQVVAVVDVPSNSISLNMKDVNTAGTYAFVTTDTKGRVTAGSNTSTSTIYVPDYNAGNALGTQVVNKNYVDAQVASLSGGAVSTLQTNVTNLQTSVTSLQSNYSSLSTSVTTLQTNYSSLSSTVSGLQTSVAGLNSSVATLQSNYSSLSASVTTLQGNYSSLSSAISTLQSNYTALSGTVSGLQTTVAGLWVPTSGTNITINGAHAVNLNPDITLSSVTANTFNSTSSIRYKTDIQELSGALDDVCSLRGVSYIMKSGGRRQVGLIAEEVEEVRPELVSYDDLGIPSGVYYQNAVGLLVEAIKELRAEVAELKKLQGLS